MFLTRLLALALALATLTSAAGDRSTSRLASTFDDIRQQQEERQAEGDSPEPSEPELQQATFGTGCFWCTEAVFEELQGVRRVVSGYSGGRVLNPTYQQVLTGLTGHAEVIHLEFDPEVVSYVRLLEVFWRTHDPTTLNRQGPDVGTQYRSAIFYHNDEQRELAEQIKRQLNQEHAFRKPIVTEITKFRAFFPAEKYHQNYFARNGRMPYCRSVIRPKLSKFRRVFREDLKRNNREKRN